MNTVPDPITAIKRHVLTDARDARNDVRIETSERGGYTLRTLSHLDAMLEAEFISEDQYQAGMLYWRLRDVLTRCDNPIFADVTGEHDDPEAIVFEEYTIEDPQTFLAIVARRIPTPFRNALDAACKPLGDQPRYILIHAFGEGVTRMAFELLEAAIPFAHEEMKNRLQRETKRVDSRAESYV
jgi:hypothetical protein